MTLTQLIFQAAKQKREQNVFSPLNMSAKHFWSARWRDITLFGAPLPIRPTETTRHGESVMSVRVVGNIGNISLICNYHISDYTFYNFGQTRLFHCQLNY